MSKLFYMQLCTFPSSTSLLAAGSSIDFPFLQIHLIKTDSHNHFIAKYLKSSSY